jgi:hypothetical protein
MAITSGSAMSGAPSGRRKRSANRNSTGRLSRKWTRCVSTTTTGSACVGKYMRRMRLPPCTTARAPTESAPANQAQGKMPAARKTVKPGIRMRRISRKIQV